MREEQGLAQNALPLATDLTRHIKAISNVFEVGTAQADYEYVEDLRDGRGFTVTQYGFCTYNDEVATIINEFREYAPGTPLAQFIPLLPPFASGIDTEALSHFPDVWRAEISHSEQLVAVCDMMADRLYTTPALAAARAAQIYLHVGQAIFYDTWLQHGAGEDGDSIWSILARTVEKTGGRNNCEEIEFLRAFLGIRREVLLHPTDEMTREGWRRSATRVDALEALLEQNPELIVPIHVINSEVDVIIR
ncbi:MAG: chitosanase [Hyphomicrobium sp.]